MATSALHTVVIVTGPVGGGKSTTSDALSKALRNFGTVAVIDLDQVYGFVRQHDGYDEPESWFRTRRTSAAMANCLFDTGMSTVVIDGEFFNVGELESLTSNLSQNVKVHFFTLEVSYESALERVKHDPTRGMSKDPVFLKKLHDDFIKALPFLREKSTVINTDKISVTEAVTLLTNLIRN